jgi:hypothetical protein
VLIERILPLIDGKLDSMSGFLGTSMLVVLRNSLVVSFLAAVPAALLCAAALRLLSHLSGNGPRYEWAHGTVAPASPAHYAAAWKDRKRRMLVFKAVQFSFLFMIAVFWYLSSSHAYVGSPLLVIAAWFVAYIVAGTWLNLFRCPRCGKLYYWRFELRGSMERQKRWRDCRYCGLPQDFLQRVEESAAR